jgi:ABC-type nitrate/sulfonate/bicarbonate transport system substrate-binding protein
VTVIRLQLDWKPNAQFAGILLAHYLGWYARAGIDLVINPGQMSQNPVDALDSPQNVIVSADDNLLIRARAAGQAVKAIAAILQFSAFGWMALKQSGIKDMNDLKGKRLGIHRDGEMALDIALAHFNMSRDDLEVVEFGFDYADVLRSGRCDAIQGFMITEPAELEASGLEIQTMPAYEWSYEAYGQVLGTTERFLAADSAAIIRFLRITFDGWRQALQDPREISRIIATHYLTDTKPDLEVRTLMAMRPFLVGKVGVDKLGWMEKGRWERSIDYLTAHQLIDNHLLAEEVMTNKLMESI